MLKEFGGGLELTENCSRSVLNSMNSTTRKVEPSKKFLEKEIFTFQIKISSVILDHDISSELVLNLDQTPLLYVSPGKYIFSLKESKNVPIKGLDDKGKLRQLLWLLLQVSFFLYSLYIKVNQKDVYPSLHFHLTSMIHSQLIIGRT